MAGAGACASKLAGVVLIVLAVISRLSHFTIGSLGPRSFAAGAGLLLLLSIAMSVCPRCGGACAGGSCCTEGEGHEHEHGEVGAKK